MPGPACCGVATVILVSEKVVVVVVVVPWWSSRARQQEIPVRAREQADSSLLKGIIFKPHPHGQAKSKLARQEGTVTTTTATTTTTTTLPSFLLLTTLWQAGRFGFLTRGPSFFLLFFGTIFAPSRPPIFALSSLSPRSFILPPPPTHDPPAPALIASSSLFLFGLRTIFGRRFDNQVTECFRILTLVLSTLSVDWNNFEALEFRKL